MNFCRFAQRGFCLKLSLVIILFSIQSFASQSLAGDVTHIFGRENSRENVAKLLFESLATAQKMTTGYGCRYEKNKKHECIFLASVCATEVTCQVAVGDGTGIRLNALQSKLLWDSLTFVGYRQQYNRVTKTIRVTRYSRPERYEAAIQVGR